MKSLFIAISAVVVIAFAALGTGNVGSDPVQTGTLTFTATTATNQTVTFPYQFTTTPLVTFGYISGGAAAAISNSSVTTTNFSVTVVQTNSAISWTAQLGYPRIETGTNGPGGAYLIFTNTFSPAFAFTPVVVMTQGSTNMAGGGVSVTNVTTSNFVFTVGAGSSNTVFQWEAFGVTAVPGNYNPNYPSVTY